MRYDKILFFFYAALPISIILRLIQLTFIVDSSTGFFKHEFTAFGIAILVIIFAVAIMFTVFAFLSHRSPEHPPISNPILNIVAIATAFGVFFETYILFLNSAVINFQTILLNTTSLLAILFFLGFGFKGFFNFNLPNFSYTFPCIYLIFKIMYEFTVVSALAIISESILLIAAYCSLMVFFLQFAKLYNKADREDNFRKLLAAGLVTVLFCFVQSIPFFIYGFMTSFKNIHTNIFSNITLFIMGCFVIIFLSLHYSRKNACS